MLVFWKDKENEKLLGNSPRNKERKIQTTVSEMRDHTYWSHGYQKANRGTLWTTLCHRFDNLHDLGKFPQE